MKYLSLILWQCLILCTAFSQSSANRQSLLWEVSGNGLAGRSYLYGSAHLNDPRIFEFDDSLFYALSACKQFAGEVNFAEVDSVLIVELQKKFIGEEPDTTAASTDDETEEDNFFGGRSPDGKPTFLDMYLYRAGMNLGLSSHGLENLPDQLDLFESLSEEDPGFNYEKGDSIYDALLATYARGDLVALQAMFREDTGAELLEMKERNLIQATSFEALAKEHPTFAVVGAAHLFGEDNVLELLRERGYVIRRVTYGRPTTRIDSLYALPDERLWYPLQGKLFNYTLESSINNEIITIYGRGELHMSSEFDLGLIAMTIVLPNANLEEAAFVAFAKESIFPDTTDLEFSREMIDDQVTRYEFLNRNYKSPFRARIQNNGSNYSIQVVLGFSASALDHPHAERYLNGLQIQQPQSIKWAARHSEEGAFWYNFPVDIPFKENKVSSAHFSERGDVTILYKTYADSDSGNEYLIRYHIMPPGITYLDPPKDLRAAVEFLANTYKREVGEMVFFTENGNPGVEVDLRHGLNDVTFYAKCIIRGALLYIAVHKAPEGVKDQSFFDGLRLEKPSFSETEVFEYPPAAFSIKASAEVYAHTASEDGGTVHGFDFNLPRSGITMLLKFKPFGKYDELESKDTLLSIHDLVNQDMVDTVFAYRSYRYGEVCPVYMVQYQQDSSHLFRTDAILFCNNHVIGLEIAAPFQFQGESYMDELFGSLAFTTLENTLPSMVGRKAPRILADLASKDTLIFNEALAAFVDYEGFTDDDIPIILDLLDKTLLDEPDDYYSAKYLIVTKLHDFESPEVEQRVADLYLRSDKEDIKERILESLSLRETETSLSLLIRLLEQSTTEQALPESLFKVFTDSVEILEQYYSKLKSITEKGLGKIALLEVISHWLEQDATYAFLEADDQWIRKGMDEQIDSFLVSLRADSSASIDAYLMDYLFEKGSESKIAEVFSAIAAAEDVYGKYRIIYHQLGHQGEVADTLLEAVMPNDYYRYWVMDGYATFERELPKQWTDQLEIAGTVMKYHIYSNYDYWCDSCALIRELPAGEVQPNAMLYLKCESGQEDLYYLGCIGPFDEEGQFSLEEDDSVYFTTPKPEAAFGEILEQFIEYYREKE